MTLLYSLWLLYHLFVIMTSITNGSCSWWRSWTALLWRGSCSWSLDLPFLPADRSDFDLHGALLDNKVHKYVILWTLILWFSEQYTYYTNYTYYTYYTFYVHYHRIKSYNSLEDYSDYFSIMTLLYYLSWSHYYTYYIYYTNYVHYLFDWKRLIMGWSFALLARFSILFSWSSGQHCTYGLCWPWFETCWWY